MGSLLQLPLDQAQNVLHMKNLQISRDQSHYFENSYSSIFKNVTQASHTLEKTFSHVLIQQGGTS